MANWAKLQEDLVGLPVAKRAKHGIHFKKGADEFIGNFSGKPCHFQENGIWKPIDTKLLLLPDGFYGCPHSPVRVHKDGHVKVEGTDYTQYTALPSATGLVDNDCIVREFSFGKQEMRITENGYRSEITLNRIPTLQEARKLIASESGTLSKEYLKSLTTATDANGDVHTYSTLSAFRTWLAQAVFPVVIDPDIIQPDPTAGKDTMIYAATSGTNYGTNSLFRAGLGAAVWRGLIQFNVSSIDSGATIVSAVCSLYCYDANSATDRNTSFYRLLVDWVEDQATWNIRKTGTNWSTAGGESGTDYTATPTVTTAVGAKLNWYTWDIQADVAAWVAGTATNNGNIVIGVETGTFPYKDFYSSDYTTDTSLRPKLAVTYSAAGTTGNPLMHRWRRI